MDQPFIPLVDLKAQLAALRPEIKAAVTAAMERCDCILGADVDAFEEEFAAFCGVPHAIGCANGTDALYLAMLALGIGPGDEVIVPAMTFVATAQAVVQAGATPVLVDVLPGSALIDPDAVDRAVTEKTKAVIPVHLFGQCADMDAVLEIARRHGLFVVEDAAQAHGAHDSRGRRAGTMGNLGCFSFYPGKNLGAYGDGGALITVHDGLADKLRQLRHLGSGRKYHHELNGPNSRLDTLQAAVLRVKLPHLEDWNDRRRAHAARYEAALAGIPGITRTEYHPGCVYHLYVIRVDGRDEVLEHLNKSGIGAGMHYPFAVHELESYRFLGHGPGAFPAAEDWARRCISLPIYPELPDDAPERVAGLLRQVLGGE